MVDRTSKSKNLFISLVTIMKLMMVMKLLFSSVIFVVNVSLQSYTDDQLQTLTKKEILYFLTIKTYAQNHNNYDTNNTNIKELY